MCSRKLLFIFPACRSSGSNSRRCLDDLGPGTWSWVLGVVWIHLAGMSLSEIRVRAFGNPVSGNILCWAEAMMEEAFLDMFFVDDFCDEGDWNLRRLDMKFHISVTKRPGGWMGMILEMMNVEDTRILWRDLGMACLEGWWWSCKSHSLWKKYGSLALDSEVQSLFTFSWYRVLFSYRTTLVIVKPLVDNHMKI